MTREHLLSRLRDVCAKPLSLPGSGSTPERHQRLFEIAREDLSLAKLAEAHFDALAILAEAGHSPTPEAVYAVWASEIPGQDLALESVDDRYTLRGSKRFCSGAGLVDRALVTVGLPNKRLVAVDMRAHAQRIGIDLSGWHTDAFRPTQTGTVTFTDAAIDAEDLIGKPMWYIERPGFWNGACGPAACWAGGAAGLLHKAQASRRDDPHTLAHLAAMEANVWASTVCLKAAGQEIDAAPTDRKAADIRALKTRHIIEQLCTDTLTRFARAYGPHPLAMDADTSRRHAELNLYLRQSHGERDLESLGQALRNR